MSTVRRGFTLIEVLVVMAIIGILAGIILAGLTNARTRAYDAAVKDNLGNIRTQAGLFYGNNGHYGDGVGTVPTNCFGAVGSMFSQDTIIQSMILAAEDANRSYAVSCTTNTTSGSNASVWSVESPLPGGGTWCVDAEGVGRLVSSSAANGVCPAS